MKRFSLCKWVLLVGVFLPFAGAYSHTLHQSTGELEWNSETNKLEISLTVFTDDFELALIRHSEKWLSLKKSSSAELDSAICDYLSKNFKVINDQGQAATLDWVGRTFDVENIKSRDPVMVLFFQFSLPQQPQKTVIHNTVLQDLFADECNLLSYRQGAQIQQFRFTPEQPTQRLKIVPEPAFLAPSSNP